MRVVATGVVEAEEDEVLLEAELMPEVSGDDWEVHSQNCGDGTISGSPGPLSSSGGFWCAAGNSGPRKG